MTPANAKRRILVAAPSYADAKAALDLAGRLAEMTAFDIRGLLLEDPVLADLVGHLRQRVVTESGEIAALPPRDRLGAIMAGELKAFERAVAEIAERRRAAWSFERGRDELVSGLFAAASTGDIALLGHRSRPGPGGRVALVAPPPDASSEAGDLGTYLARSLGTVVNSPGIHAGEAAGLLDWVNRIHARVVIVDLATGPVRTPEELRRLAEAARCPVLVLGVGRAER
jgi:hypothetical protein